MSDETEVTTIKVLSVNYSYYNDVRPMRSATCEWNEPIQFDTFLVPHPNPQESIRGEQVNMGLADVPEHLYEEFYKDHPAFEKLDDYLARSRENLKAAKKARRDELGDDDEDDDEETVEVEETTTGEGIKEGATPEAKKGEPDPLAGVKFNNPQAKNLAAEMGLTAEDMGRVMPTGKATSYTVPNVRAASKKKGSATE